MIDQVGTRSLTDLWAEHVRAHPDRTWLVYEDRAGTVREYTYADFDRAVDRVVAGFRSLGVGHGDAVVLHLRNCPEFVMSWFALAALGAVMVPSNVANTAVELAYLIESSEAVAVVTGGDLLEVVHAATDTATVRTVVGVGVPDSETVVSFDGLVAAASSPGTADPAPDGPAVDGDTVLQILFTSGTTAKPKGVVATHANALWSAESGAKGLGVEPSDRFLTALPLFHVNAQAVTVLSSLRVGATVVLLEVFDPKRYLDQLRTHRATATSLVAAQAKALLAEPPRPDDARHDVRRCGFAINIPDVDKEAFERRFGVSFVNIYGLSEAMAIVAMSPLHGDQAWPSVGLPAMNRLVRIVDAEGRDLPTGQIGEIVVHGVPGRTVMKEYFKDPGATAAVMTDGWVRTGDSGCVDERGYLYFYERLKDVIKCSGQNVSASEVEAVLVEHPAIEDAAVIGVPDERRGETVKAFVVLAPDAQLAPDAVIAHCATRLARFKLPQYVEFRAELPRTSVGKLAKGELRSDG